MKTYREELWFEIRPGAAIDGGRRKRALIKIIGD
jgi:hypothetical protein